MITKITQESPACFGVLCDKHQDCKLYFAVDGSPDTVQRIDSCADYSTGERPLFVRVEITGEVPT